MEELSDDDDIVYTNKAILSMSDFSDALPFIRRYCTIQSIDESIVSQ